MKMFKLNESIHGIYLGDRGISFKTLIMNVLKKGNLKTKYIDILTSKESMKEYASAFTSELIDENNNYQVYEQLGDLSGNKFIVWYIYKRFPQLKCSKGVKVAARLRINYGSKQSFYKIAEDLGFWDFISAPNDLRQRKKKPLLEDVFEAFLGVTEYLLDSNTKVGVGYAAVYSILTAIFDTMKISIDYKDLYDAKTRLKELFDMFGANIGLLQYEETKDELITTSTVYRLEGATYEVRRDGSINTKKIVNVRRKIPIGIGSASLKCDAQQIAASKALETMKRQGFVKEDPVIYSEFKNEYVKQKTNTGSVFKILKNNNINEQLLTKGKTKYQSKYTSTVLGKYCRENDYEGIKICLDMGANPNELDSDGLSCLDLLLIGSVDEKIVYKSIKRMKKCVDGQLLIQKNVYDVYYIKYTNRRFEEFNNDIKIV